MRNEQVLLDVCSEILDVPAEELSLGTSKDEVDNFDSLAVIQIMAELCERLNIQLDDEAMANTSINVIGDFLKLIQL